MGAELKDRWLACFNSGPHSESEWQDLSALYCQAHRYYHTLSHVAHCLDLLAQSPQLAEDARALEMAIWFHDVIYNPKKSDNEEKSADYAAAVLKRFSFGADTIQKVHHLIVLTRHPSNPVTGDEKLLIDIDLSILGADEAAYDRYEAAIRREYSFAPGILYRRGRKKVLKSFLGMDRIYLTDRFNHSHEKQARVNLMRALKSL